MKQWVRNLSFLLIIGTTLGNLGLLGSDLYRTLALLSFLIFVSTFLPGIRIARDVRLTHVAAALVVALTGIWVSRQADLGLLHLYLFLSLALVILFWQRDTEDVRQFASYFVALAGVGVLAELVRLSPLFWHLRMGTASMLSDVGEFLAREDRNLGPTAMGLSLLASLIVLGVVKEIFAQPRQRYRWMLVVALLVATHLFYLWVLKYYARWLSRHPGWDELLLNSQHLFLILGATVFTLIDRRRPLRSPGPFFHKRVFFASALGFVTGVVIASWLGWAAPSPHNASRVMIYDAGYLDWRIPVHGVYGERSAGMFGMLPSTLEAVGFEVVVSDDLTLLSGPNPPACVMMINIQEYIGGDDKERIWRFVKEGGGLICLGDHTGVAGIRGPFNDLLEPAGIRFEFDSSTFFGRGWNDALDRRCHPLNRGMKSAEDYQMWVGASLGLDVGARPVVVAKYGYSDIGDPANFDRSYLGDRRYNPDELLGDIVLVADANVGDGKVMVFGDTSGYQNLALVQSLDSVTRSLDYLSSQGGTGSSPAAQVVAVLIIALLVVGTVWFWRNGFSAVGLVFGLAVGSAVVTTARPAPPRLTPRFLDKSPIFSFEPTPHVKRDVAIIDFSHGGHHTIRAWKDKSLGGLQLNLARNGYFPLIRDAFPYRDLEDGASLLMVVAPSRQYSKKEIDAVEEFMLEGGTAVVSVGFEELEGSRDLLERFGFTVANAPLGRFVVGEESDSLAVLFHEGWPVAFDGRSDTEVLLSKWDLPLVVKRSIGEGKIVVIGDSSFFHDVNLETLDQYFAGNVAFLRELTEAGGPR
ncbi:MAG: hypothetical protein JSW58_05610 [Candidatus Latescibacterota bacterium]|nr:MAG: hypothetical protein JSW58_05610 [Candidatus Latescibacterota bacterium]